MLSQGMREDEFKIGAVYYPPGKCQFRVWAPFREKVSLRFVGEEKIVPMQRQDNGYWIGEVEVSNTKHPLRYFYYLDETVERPDPASAYQPEGVHGPSELVDHASFMWEDRGWQPPSLAEMVIYEIHIGTFTHQGTFNAAIERLDDLKEMGINAVEVMPVAQFPGERNWGYDGVYPFSVQASYGGPEGFKKFINAAHLRGIAVILDVVYNHLGPEGNYLRDFGPYFTDRYKTPWGEAINFDGPYSDHVRAFFIANALYWFSNYHIDALRLDAIHGIFDMSAKHILAELSEKVNEFSRTTGKRVYLIAESDLNDARLIRKDKKCGYSIDAQWCDDFHHSLHTLLTGEEHGYYQDFGKVVHLAKSYREGFVYTWDYSSYRRRYFGSSSLDVPAERFVVFSQNHDQVGNRPRGERLSHLVSFSALKLAAGAVLLSPYIPLLFMGEEYAEEAPFFYFVSHNDPRLIEAVREGRQKEAEEFFRTREIVDPQCEDTFLRCKLNWEKRKRARGRVLCDFYKELIRLRRTVPALGVHDKDSIEVICDEEKKLFLVRRWRGQAAVFCAMNFNREQVNFRFPFAEGRWMRIFDSSDKIWDGEGSLMPDEIRGSMPLHIRGVSFSLYRMEEK